MLLLNLGCGSQVHPEWVNIDNIPQASLRHLPVLRRFAPSWIPPNYMNHDLRRGIPFSDGEADAVYSSHLLEHLPLNAAALFLKENWRVLRCGGVIRIVVPDLELAARKYLGALEKCSRGGEDGNVELEWATILLLDQMVRSTGGGRMREWLVAHRDTAFVKSMEGIFKQIAETPDHASVGFSLGALKSWWRGKNTAVHSGELHRWMYDKLSLGRLLETCGFDLVEIVDPDASRIPNWNSYYLDRLPDGTIHQPGSIYIEGVRNK